MKVRIAKFLAACGLGSRRNCEELVTSGRIRVNGELIDSPAFSICPDEDKIELDDNVVEPKERVYYLLNKPTGYTSTLADKHAVKLISELVPNEIPVWPVGRLDKETSGLIILTNDGELTQRLTHPKYEKSKTYIATTDKPLTDIEIEKLKRGIELDDGYIQPDFFVVLKPDMFEIGVHEGRNRLIRRIFEYFGKNVIVLHRSKLAFLEAGKLKIGEYRKLTNDEVEKLKNA